MRLPSKDAPMSEQYSMPDPDHLPEAMAAVHHWLYSGQSEPTREEFLQVLSMAGGYRDLTTYVLGQEHCVSKLRDIWRARRRRAAE